MTTVLHDDKKARLRLIITDARAAQLLSGKTPAAGVEVTTEPHDSLHWGNRLVRLDALKDWLDDAKTLDERSMRWKGAQYAEALRFGRRVLVCAGENNARNLQSVGLTFEEEAEAKRFFTSFATVRPKGWVDTGSVYVEGKGGISREYLGGSAHSKRGVHAAIVRVLDEVSFLTTVDKKGKRTEKRTVHVNEAAALAALNAFELAWYREGGRQHEIEFMKTLLRRKDRTLLDWAAEEVPLQADPVRFTRKLLQDAPRRSGSAAERGQRAAANAPHDSRCALAPCRGAGVARRRSSRGGEPSPAGARVPRRGPPRRRGGYRRRAERSHLGRGEARARPEEVPGARRQDAEALRARVIRPGAD